MPSQPLQYNISDWHQLSDAKSNNSRDLSISVSDIIQDARLTGLRIQLNHTQFGVLFACVLNAQGSMVTEFNENLVVEFTTEQILAELKKYGFLITFEPRAHLPGNQIQYLMTLKGLGYDKLRIMNVYKYNIQGTKQFQWYVIAFNIHDENWLDNGYSISETEFMKALKDGRCINISAISKTQRWSWSWLDYVANIDDILEDNA